ACPATPASSSRCPTSTRATPTRPAWARCASTSSRRTPTCPPTLTCPAGSAGGRRSAAPVLTPASSANATTRSSPKASPTPTRTPARQTRGAPGGGAAAPLPPTPTQDPDLPTAPLTPRRTLLQQMDDQVRGIEAQPAVGTFDRTQQRAFGLLTGSKVRAAFD